MDTFDVLVVGNGVLGLSSAYALKLGDPSLTVAIVGPRARPGSATLAAGAMLNCFAEVTKLTFQSKNTIEKFEIAKKAHKLWPTWIDEINARLAPEDHVQIKPGTFVLLNTKAGKRENDNYLAIHNALMNAQEPFEEVEPTGIPGLNPVDDFRPLRALYLPNEGSLNPAKLLNALEKILNNMRNVTFINDIATNLLLDNDRVIGINTKDLKNIRASQVLLAAGSYTQKLLEQIPSLVYRIPKILASPGCSLILKANNHQCQHVIRTPLRSGSCGVHIIPQIQPNTLYLGASSTIRIAPKIKPKVRDVYYLLKHGMEQFNQDLREASIIQSRVGNRPVTFDTFPLVGKTSIIGLWILTGTYRDGLFDSPILSTSIAKEILNKPPLLKHSFQPERFPLETISKTALMEEVTDQYISLGYEHGLQAPKLKMWSDSDIRMMVYKHFESIDALSEIDIALAPDIFIMLYYSPEKIRIFREYYKKVREEFRLTHVKSSMSSVNTELDIVSA